MTKEFESVLDVRVTVGAPNVLDLALNCAGGDLDTSSARSADEMVVVLFASAKPIELHPAAVHRVDETCSFEVLEGAVDRRQANALSSCAQLAVEVLRAREAVGAIESAAVGSTVGHLLVIRCHDHRP
jgi:hypothetical protein